MLGNLLGLWCRWVVVETLQVGMRLSIATVMPPGWPCAGQQLISRTNYKPTETLSIGR
ncbi:hypothetical protein HMPREF0290_1999 [Corynebacterium efficiens YS-314]|uniref:Uncharacterized protein n=1 Tax=Corynebacterium efficiens (strain DSM 44549 / YS-314 / AJ 12310 / JCM 11189 / NBRC 100395) TaxID=196164 RepID=Q8FP22_COREF|nr:hypothetical protein HMPREF0290_1999 [Corynebacterium efficiens YS-314]BAC18779.1 hypothetical protein [Corynebacterium efficiens YS-314]